MQTWLGSRVAALARPVATAPIQPLAWEPPYAAGAAQKIATTTTKDKKKKRIRVGLDKRTLVFIKYLFQKPSKVKEKALIIKQGGYVVTDN